MSAVPETAVAPPRGANPLWPDGPCVDQGGRTYHPSGACSDSWGHQPPAVDAIQRTKQRIRYRNTRVAFIQHIVSGLASGRVFSIPPRLDGDSGRQTEQARLASLGKETLLQAVAFEERIIAGLQRTITDLEEKAEAEREAEAARHQAFATADAHRHQRAVRAAMIADHQQKLAAFDAAHPWLAEVPNQ